MICYMPAALEKSSVYPVKGAEKFSPPYPRIAVEGMLRTDYKAFSAVYGKFILLISEPVGDCNILCLVYALAFHSNSLSFVACDVVLISLRLSV